MTVVASRGFSSLILLVPMDCASSGCANSLGHWLFWLLLAVIVATAVWSVTYLNKAMQRYGNSQVAPAHCFCRALLVHRNERAVLNPLACNPPA